MDDTDELSDDQLWARLAGAEPGERAAITLELAERAASLDDHERTVTMGKAAAVAAETAASATVQARATLLVADAHAGLGRTEHALAGYAAAASLYRGLVDERELAVCHFRAGWALLGADRLEEALEEWHVAERLLSGLDGCEDDLGRCALGRAVALEQLGRRDEALDALRIARDAFRAYGDPRQTAWADERAASVLLGLGRSTEAVGRLESCLSVAEASGDLDRLARAELQLGHALRVDDRADEALRMIRRARRSFRRQGRLADVASCDRESGICHATLGRHEKAHRHFVRSRAVSDAAGDDAGVRAVDLDIGALLWSVGRTEESLAATRRGLESAVAEKDQSAAFPLTTRLAGCLLDLGRADEAAKALQECPDVPPAAGVVERALRLRARARLALDAGDHVAATALVDEGLALLEGSARTSVQASLYAVRAQATESCDPAGSMADRARAVALHLADGDVRRAEELARPFLPVTDA